MNKEKNKCAAGLRRSAIAERIRLREEWSALKGTNENAAVSGKHIPSTNTNKNKKTTSQVSKAKVIHSVSDVLAGVVALVEVGKESKALPLRAALTALGATVVPLWNPLVTHLVWSEGGCRSARAKARALASRLVSPLWVEACAVSGRKLPEQTFPAASRTSDLPSPRTLKRLLKQADEENIPLADLLSDDSKQESKGPRLRLSSDTDRNSSSTDKSTDTTRDTSRDTSHNTNIESRVNTAPRRHQPVTVEVPKSKKSRRQLFTYKEGENIGATSDESETEVAIMKRPQPWKLTQRECRNLARAERMARRLATVTTTTNQNKPTSSATQTACVKVVLTGMSRLERRLVYNGIHNLSGRIQNQVNRKTTHVLLGSCKEDTDMCVRSGRDDAVDDSTVVEIQKCDKSSRTLNALEGAARGCKVLYAQWALDCLKKNQWLHHHGYEVEHLKKISQKARIERKALGKTYSEYAYDVFCGMRVYVTPAAEQREAALRLLNLCGAVVVDEVVRRSDDCDVTIGAGEGEISTKWVFDSVAASRMRTTRRYINTIDVHSVEAEMSQMMNR